MNAMPIPFPRRDAASEAVPTDWEALADALVTGTSRGAIETLLARWSFADAEADPFDPQASRSLLRRALIARLNRA